MANENVVKTSKPNHGLLPCPFCGTDAELNTASNSPDWMIISCPNIMCIVLPRVECIHADLQETIAAWNNRHTPKPTAHETSELPLARNALSNLYMACLRFGPIDEDIRFAMGEVSKVLGGPHPPSAKASAGEVLKDVARRAAALIPAHSEGGEGPTLEINLPPLNGSV